MDDSNKVFKNKPANSVNSESPMFGALAGAASSLVNNLFNIGSAKRQFEREKQLQQRQFDFNEKAAQNDFARQKEFYALQRDDERAYNDPNAVRQRYEAAGINPTAAFGTAGSYSPMTSPSGSVNSQSGVGLGSAPSAFPFSDPIEAAFRMAQIENIEADTEKIKGDTKDPGETKRSQVLDNELKAKGIINAELDAKLKSFDASFTEATLPTAVAIEGQKLKNLETQCDQMNQEIAESQSRVDLNFKTQEEKDQAIRESASRILLNNAHAALLAVQDKWHGKLSEKQIELMDSQIADYVESASVKHMQRFVEHNKIATQAAETRLKIAEAFGREMDNLKDKATYLDENDVMTFMGQVLSQLENMMDSLSPFKSK